MATALWRIRSIRLLLAKTTQQHLLKRQRSLPLVSCVHRNQQQHQQQHQQRFQSSAFIPETVKDAVKESFLNEVTKSDSKVWSSSVPRVAEQEESREDQQDTNHDRYFSLQNTRRVNGTIHEATTYGLEQQQDEETPMEEDWCLDRQTKYWPDLPPSVVYDSEEADPFVLSQEELDTMDQTIREDLLQTEHPVLNKAATYFFQSSSEGGSGGKKIRPRMVLLISKTLWHHHQQQEDDLSFHRADLADAQRRLAEISELIHTASLFHDDVIDEAETRRGLAAVHHVFGNKVAILAGDYLLARASIGLARLRQADVTECMSTIIEHLVRGEVMQMKNNYESSANNDDRQRMVYYLRKNYFKTGSLMANSCQSAALLGNYPYESVLCAYQYGKHLGTAFQLVDDVLDYEGTLQSLGKPALNDLKAGLATAPVLFALEEQPTGLLPELVQRKFQNEGDVEEALRIVKKSNGIAKTKQLARNHAEKAMEAVLILQPSVYRDALVYLAHKVVERTH